MVTNTPRMLFRVLSRPIQRLSLARSAQIRCFITGSSQVLRTNGALSLPLWSQKQQQLLLPLPSSATRHFASSPFDQTNHNVQDNATGRTPKRRRRRELKFVPLKPAVDLTPKARSFFLQLTQNPPRPDICGVRLNYHQASSGEPRMVFSFAFVTEKELDAFDEAVPLLVGNKSTEESNNARHDDTATESDDPNNPSDHSQEVKQPPTLYVSGNAFLKVLGAKVDLDNQFMPVLYDKEGNKMDPNA